MKDAVAVSATRKSMKELADGSIRVSLDIDPRFRTDFFRLFPEIDAPVVLAPLAYGVALEQVQENAEHHDEIKPAKKRGGFTDDVGPLCRLAVMWCSDQTFHEWLNNAFPEEADAEPFNEVSAKILICDLCHIASRRELDTDKNAAAVFHERFRFPYIEHLQEMAHE